MCLESRWKGEGASQIHSQVWRQTPEGGVGVAGEGQSRASWLCQVWEQHAWGSAMCLFIWFG